MMSSIQIRKTFIDIESWFIFILILITKYTYKTNISSGFSNIQTKVPAVCDGVSMTFQPSADEGNKSLNNTQLSLLPNVSEVVFTFNDSTNSLVSYSIKDDEELVERYLESYMLLIYI